MPRLLLEMGTIRFIYFTTKLPYFQDFHAIKSLPEWIFYVNIRFKSRLLHLFVPSWHSKKTQKVHQRFRGVSAAESNNSGLEAADRPVRSPILLDFALFLP